MFGCRSPTRNVSPTPCAGETVLATWVTGGSRLSADSNQGHRSRRRKRQRKPGTIARVFNTHPMTEDRLVQTQKNIAEMLPNRPEYVVTTSEFNDVRARLKARDVRKPQDDPNHPRLRKSPSMAAPGEDADERPTLKRRDLVD